MEEVSMASQQVEEYLEAFGKLEERGEQITTSSLARECRVSPPSVTEMLHRLAERGLVSYEPRGRIELTEEGRAMSRSMVRRHRLWERFLHDVLRVGWDRVHDEACRLEHATSPEVERELARVLGDSPTCPHGYSIPDSDGHTDPQPAIPLVELPPAQLARIVNVREDDTALLRTLGGLGLRPGVLVEALSPVDGKAEVALRIGGASRSVSRQVAEAVNVAPISLEEATRVIPLTQLAPGETGTVDQMTAGKTFLGRCLALGFTPGTPVIMIQNSGRGAIIVRVRDTRVALGRGEAQKIHVLRRAEPHDQRAAS